MRTTTKWTLAALAVVALAGVAAAATEPGQQATDSVRSHFGMRHGPDHGGHDPWHAIERFCDDNMTVGDCKVVLEAKHDEMRQCLETGTRQECHERVMAGDDAPQA